MYQFMEYISEAKRREYIYNLNGLLKSSKLWLYDHYRNAAEFYFHFEEKIVSVKNKKKTWLFDECFKKELLKIESHENVSALNGNMVHYIISSRSVEAASIMTETLMQSLLAAKRISSKRMEIITEIEPDVYRHNNKFEEIIENNYGGGIVFDLSEKFGTDPTDYVMTGKYIERLVKKYRNHCLFVFTYNIDHPGFSYYLLPQLKKYVIPITLREGSGTRKEAVNFLKALIKDSEYAQYSDQAGEYMKLFPGDEFSQTDVLTAYEQFGSWCLNKNVFKAYDYGISEEFLLDRDENTDSSYEKLQTLVGLDLVKNQIDSIIASDVVEKERKRRMGSKYQTSSMHMIFGGNPGSAKTTVAKLKTYDVRARI